MDKKEIVSVNQNALNTMDAKTVENLLLKGDLSGLSEKERVEYYLGVCHSLGLNPATKPFGYISFKGQLKLYAQKDCTEQLRKIHGVSVVESKTEFHTDCVIVTVKVQDREGRYDIDMGLVNTLNLKGEDFANAVMKAQTKAKRRATLSICGLGILDESETDTIGKYETVPIQDNVIEEEVKEIDYKKELKKYLNDWKVSNDEIVLFMKKFFGSEKISQEQAKSLIEEIEQKTMTKDIFTEIVERQ